MGKCFFHWFGKNVTTAVGASYLNNKNVTDNYYHETSGIHTSNLILKKRICVKYVENCYGKKLVKILCMSAYFQKKMKKKKHQGYHHI
jgi:hypothetical protein